MVLNIPAYRFLSNHEYDAFGFFVVVRQGQARSAEAVFLPLGKKPLNLRGAYRLPLVNEYVRLSVRLAQILVLCVLRGTIDCESCMPPISTNPASTGANKLKLSRVT